EAWVGERHHKVSVVRSVDTSWTYVSLQPFDLFAGKVRYVRNIALLSLLANLILGTIIALYSSYINSKPLAGLLRQLEYGLGRGGGAIADPFQRILDDSSALQHRLALQTPIVRGAFARRVLAGSLVPGGEAEPSLLKLPAARDETFFAVLSAQLRLENVSHARPHREWALYRAAIREIVSESLSGDGSLIDVDEYAVNVIIALGGDDESERRRELLTVADRLRRTLVTLDPYSFVIGIGRAYRGLHEAHRSFAEARRAARHGVHHGIPVQYSDALPTSKHMDYPPQLEEQIITCACAGKIDRVRQLLLGVRERNVVRPRLRPEVVTLLMHNLLGTALKAEEAAMRDLYDDSDSIVLADGPLGAAVASQNAALFFDRLERLFETICTKVEEQKRSHNRRLAESIQEYVESHFTDPLLCLDAVADRFHLSRFHLSQFFREQTGEHFSNCVERLRIERAKELLRRTEFSIREIVRRTGYGSPNSFARAFKRTTGTTATEYRMLSK
ncbi:MAG: helix-turn-helix domain-containing protein, partial [Spirochaetales bacterium]|nr:helix-turn-helix domain-containing protein [Spirochaetales bacterium]